MQRYPLTLNYSLTLHVAEAAVDYFATALARNAWVGHHTALTRERERVREAIEGS